MPTEAKMKRLAKSLKMMVARDGIEPPTPAFSVFVQSVFSTTSKVRGRLPSTCKDVEATAIADQNC